MSAFTAERVGDWAVWDTTGRINVLNRASDSTLDTLADSGLREVALGIGGTVRGAGRCCGGAATRVLV